MSAGSRFLNALNLSPSEDPAARVTPSLNAIQGGSDALFQNGVNLSASEDPARVTRVTPLESLSMDVESLSLEVPAVADIVEPPHQRRRLYLVPQDGLVPRTCEPPQQGRRMYLVPALVPCTSYLQTDSVNLTREELQELVQSGVAYVDSTGPALIRNQWDAPEVPRPADTMRMQRTPEPHPDEPSAVRRHLTPFASTCEATLIKQMMRGGPANEQPTLTGVIATLPPAPTTPPSPVPWNAVPAIHPWPHNWHPSVDDTLACSDRLQPGGTCQEACDAGNDALYKKWFLDPENGTQKNFVFIQNGKFLP